MNIHQLSYPIGQFQAPMHVDQKTIANWIASIEAFPIKLAEAVKSLSVVQLNLRYRPGGWSIKQVVHHCADSHMNSFIRFKLALTEESPIIRPYYEDRWAELNDGLDDDISDSVLLLMALHSKWVKLLKGLTPAELEKEFIHPDHGKRFSLKENIGFYAWHCKHHFAHIKQALQLAEKN